MKVIYGVLVAALAFLGTESFAADRSAIEAALKLLDAMDMKTTLSRTIEQATAAEIEKNPSLGPYRAVFLEFMNRHMGYENIKDDMAALYAEAFTQQELIQLAEFYKTPLGKKAMLTVPELMIKGGQYGEKKVSDNIAELQSMIAAEAKRIQALQAK
jgi:uncharacterized protein